MAKIKMSIYFIDGTDVTFLYPKQDVKEHSVKKTVDEFLDNQHLILEGEGEVYMFPYNNVKYIKITPADEVKIPETAIRNVTLEG